MQSCGQTNVQTNTQTDKQTYKHTDNWLHLAGLPAPTESVLIPEVFDVKRVLDLWLRHSLLAVDPGPPLAWLLEVAEERGENEVQEDEEEEEEGEQLQPLVACQVHEPSNRLREREGLQVARQLDLCVKDIVIYS